MIAAAPEPAPRRSSAASPNTRGAPNGTIAATAVSTPNSAGCGTPVDHIGDPQQHPLAHPDQHHPSTVPRTEAMICRPTRSPPGPNARWLARRNCSVRCAAVAEQEEQRQDGEPEQHHAMHELKAEMLAEGEHPALMQPLQQFLGVVRVGEVIAPPTGQRNRRRMAGAAPSPARPCRRVARPRSTGTGCAPRDPVARRPRPAAR